MSWKLLIFNYSNIIENSLFNRNEFSNKMKINFIQKNKNKTKIITIFRKAFHWVIKLSSDMKSPESIESDDKNETIFLLN